MGRRTRQSSPHPKGLPAGQVLRRDVLNAWGWVGTEISDPSSITRDHLLATCGFSRRNNRQFCKNKYTSKSRSVEPSRLASPNDTKDDTPDDVIVISDSEDDVFCSQKLCRHNSNCLNYLGQDKWEDEDSAINNFLPLAKLGENPLLLAKDPDLPVGLKNLGATCYANASLQVWFRDPIFRAGVYDFPMTGPESKFMDSPIFQLQVTFAALQESIQSVFNPTNLVESLQLRTAEQQDAQEFSKLFMTHLDTEFKKQPNTSIQSLINAQFEGEQVYGTLCDNCGYCSERSTNFWEIEVNFQNNSKLEDRIEGFLEPETLTGDNKYFCVHCDSLQDATRYTELRKLPPVLHISLMRFVYDFDKMERKKSKSSIAFPKVLNMNQFLGSSAEKKVVASEGSTCNVYELRGILLHKGPSAYHGHYEAQVFDAGSDSWYQFNDEEVTRIDKLGDKRSTRKVDIGVDDTTDEKLTGSKRKKLTNGSRKRQRVDDSEDEATTPLKPNQFANPSDISSKDAYMLIYALRQSDTKMPISQEVTPPPRAMNVVNELNAMHDKGCEKYTEREKMARSALNARRTQVLDIYRSWSVTSEDQDCVVVSGKALKDWLSVHSVASVFPDNEAADQGPTRIHVNDILCEHGGLDHRKADMMKRISREAYNKIIERTNCVFEPALSLDDVCKECVNAAFKERLYQIEHPRIVALFNDKVASGNNDTGYWISKAWLKDWLLQKPKMHVTSEDDPPPDSPDFENDVRCEHGGLSLNIAARKRISPEACDILASLFPEWKPVLTEDELCSVCKVTVSERKASTHEDRKRAESEKAKMKHMYDYAFDGDMFLLEKVPCVLIPLAFLRSWKKWINKPTEATRPSVLDNSRFFCEHDKLNLDITDIESTAAIIKRAEWEQLEALYSAHPLIALNRSGNEEIPYELELPVCYDCRLKRLSDWEKTDITLRIHEGGSKMNGARKQAVYGKNSARQSKRLRQLREGEKRRLTVTKLMTVKDIKVAIQEMCEIVTICQRLYLHGKELLDNEATIESLNVLTNDILELYEEGETLDISESYDVVPQREEGRGFGGTLLGVLD